MGGGTSDDVGEALDLAFPDISSEGNSPPPGAASTSPEDDGTPHSFLPAASSSSESCYSQKRRNTDYQKLMRYYQNAEAGEEARLEAAKSRVLSYTPGAWFEAPGGLKKSDYEVPETTTVLLVGPRGSGKSTLVNKISRVLEGGGGGGGFSLDRAQETYDLSMGEGTCFLQEYMVPRGSTSFCLYDTRSISDIPDDFKLLNDWMIDGVRHGQMVLRNSDDMSMKMNLELKARQAHHCATGKKRMVNFVMFVVDARSILKFMNGEEAEHYTTLIAEAFRLPCLSFKNDKPAVVVTHGDELSLSARTLVRIYLGKLLGVPPDKQLFDIPDSYDLKTKLAIMDVLIYSLEHADRNLPLKLKVSKSTNIKGFLLRPDSKVWLISSALLFLLLALLVGLSVRGTRMRPSSGIDWHAVRPSARIMWDKIRPSARMVWKAVQPSRRRVHWREIRHLWLDE